MVNKMWEFILKFWKRIILLVLGLVSVSFGTSLMMKANLGQTCVAAFAQNVEFLSGIKSGTIMALFNYLTFVIQIILLRSEFKPIQILQLVVTTVFGAIVNFFNYDLSITANLNPDAYILKVIILFFALVFMALGVSAMLKADLTFLPYEGFCNAIIYKVGKPFSKVRPIIDMSIIGISVILIIIFKIPNTTVREGSIVCTLLFGSFVGMFNKKLFKC